MAINGIGSSISSFQRSTSAVSSNDTSSASNLGSDQNVGSSQDASSGASDVSNQISSDQAVSESSDTAGISQEAEEASGSQGASGSAGNRAEELTAKLKESLEAIASAKESGGDAQAAVTELQETYKQGESDGQLEGVETDVKDQTEQVLGIKSGGTAGSATSADGTAAVGEANAGSETSSGGQQGAESYSSGVKSGLDALLGAA